MRHRGCSPICRRDAPSPLGVCNQSYHRLSKRFRADKQAEFPATYLGLPISNKKFRKADLLPWVEKLGDRLPGWKASLMNLVGRVTWVHFVHTAIPIYMMCDVNMPKWFIKAVDKLRRGFAWKGRKEANGGSCLVAWENVQWPLELGGMGILNLEYMGWALHMKWLWQMKSGSNYPWKGLEIKNSSAWGRPIRHWYL